jgi:transformation/transcription domain-associated protein
MVEHTWTSSNLITSQIANQKTELLNLRLEINDEIASRMVPSNVLTKVEFRVLFYDTGSW